MRTLTCAVILLACVGLALLGCTDKSQSVVAPEDQGTPAKEQGSLGKAIFTSFTATEHPVAALEPGEVKLVGGNLIVTGVVIEARVEADNPLVTGTLVISASLRLDASTGEGPENGKLTLTPDADVGGGVWECTWEGFRTKTGESEWTTNIRVVGQGKGGTIQGMQIFTKEALHSWELVAAYYLGYVEGTIKSH